MRLSTTLLAAALLTVPAATASATPALGRYDVGIASRTIAVDPDGSFGGAKVFLGGYGIGGPSPVGPGLGDRFATGNLGVGPSVRAFVVGAGRSALAIATIEGQGWFAGTRDGKLGLEDIRKQVAADTHGALPADHVVVQSDHTHGGPDFMGVWGGVPLSYRRYAFDQTVAAVEAAYAARRPGSLWYGTADGADLLHNQFAYDEANKSMDSDVRVLQARDPGGRAFATLLNFSAHATVLGADNTLATGDWVQEANRILEQRLGGRAMTMVGTLGRTQPDRAACADASLKGAAASLCELDDYAGRVADRAQVALRDARPLTGPPVVAAASFLITDPASSPLLLGMLYGGAPVGIPINRSMTPPFMTGNVIGTVTSSARIGDVLLSTGPGEMYPQIPLKVRALLPGLRGYMTAGLADDQLGYLIAPYRAYTQPIKTSFFDASFANGDVIGACTAAPSPTCAGDPTPRPLANDNYFFNVSHTLGDRVTCSLLRGAGDLFGRGLAPRRQYHRCAAFANDRALPEGADVTTSGG